MELFTMPLHARYFSGRREEMAALQEVVAGNCWNGAMIIGPGGIGKTALLQHILKDETAVPKSLYLRGTPLTGDIPYAILGLILADLGVPMAEGKYAHLGTVLAALTEMFEHHHTTVKPLVVVDNAEHADSWSALVLARLVLSGTITLIVVCRNMDSIPGDFAKLWRSGYLRRLDVVALTCAETVEFAAGELGRPCSRRAGVELWRLSLGNPLHLKLLIKSEVAHGRMELNRNTWIWAPRKGPQSQGVEIGNVSRVVNTRQPNLEVLQLVALAGALPVATLLALFPADDIDSLQDAGDLVFSGIDGSTVRVASSLLASLMRAAAPSEDGRRMFQRLQAGGLLDSLADINGAMWAISCGEKPDWEVLLRAVECANDHGEYSLALELLEHTETESSPTEFVAGKVGTRWELQRCRALLGSGEFAAVVAETQHLVDGWAQGSEADEWTGVGQQLILRARALAHIDFRVGQPEEMLTLVERMLGNDRITSVEKTLVRDELLLTRCDCARRIGDFSLVMELIGGLPADWTAHCTRAQLQLASRLAEAYALCGRQDEALELAEVIATMAGLSVDAVSVDLGCVAHELMTVYFASGEWPQLKEMDVLCLSQGLLVSDDSGTEGELWAGVYLAFAGDYTQALAALKPAMAQLRVQNASACLALAVAAVGYCSAALGQDNSVPAETGPTLLAAASSQGLVGLAIDYFETLNIARTQTSAQACEYLDHTMSKQTHEANSTARMILLSAGVMLGNSGWSEELAAAASSQQGVLAAVLAIYAKGVMAQDSEVLIQSVEMAQGMGHDSLARAAAEGALLASSAATLRSTRHQLQRLASFPITAAEETNDAGHHGLTDREMAVTQLAAQGQSNREIAEYLGVSVRTVEGHLYQVYSKLQVSSRSELGVALGVAE